MTTVNSEESTENSGNNLTNRDFWRKYWQNYHYNKIPEKTIFDRYIAEDIKTNTRKTFIEIGGFPGIMSIYFLKKYQCETTLLDFYIDKQMVNKMETLNQVEENSVECIESDFFEFQSLRKYDLVFSHGFIEHFDDTADVIKRHVQLLEPDGNLLIVLPNFRGLNGWIQKVFDKENFEAHNLNSMIIDDLKCIMSGFNLSNVKIEYTAKPIVWLEPKPTKWNKITRVVVKTLSWFIKLFPIKSKLLSPYIVITGKNNR